MQNLILTQGSDSIEIETADCLANQAGRVVVNDAASVKLEITHDERIAALGITLPVYAGRREMRMGRDCVAICDEHLSFVTHKGQTLYADLSTRPLLLDLCANREQIQQAIDAGNEAMMERRKAAWRANLNRELDEIAAGLPADSVRVEIEQDGDLDGMPIYKYRAGDIELNWRDIKVIGWTSDQRHGIGSIPQSSLDAIIADRAIKAAEVEARKQVVQEQRAAAFAEAATTGKPVELSRHTTDCNDDALDCSTDIVRVLAMPDGRAAEDRIHCY